MHLAPDPSCHCVTHQRPAEETTCNSFQHSATPSTQEVDGTPHTPETEEYGISSFVWTDQHIGDPRRRFFHPGHLWTAITAGGTAGGTAPATWPNSGGSGVSRVGTSAPAADAAPGFRRGSASGGACHDGGDGSRMQEAAPTSLPACLRSKGFFRLAHHPQARWQWSTAGDHKCRLPDAYYRICNRHTLCRLCRCGSGLSPSARLLARFTLMASAPSHCRGDRLRGQRRSQSRSDEAASAAKC